MQPGQTRRIQRYTARLAAHGPCNEYGPVTGHVWAALALDCRENQIKMTAINTALTSAWMLSLIVIPVLVFLKTRMPRSTSAQQVISDYDAQLASIEAHLQANRAIVSTLPS